MKSLGVIRVWKACGRGFKPSLRFEYVALRHFGRSSNQGLPHTRNVLDRLRIRLDFDYSAYRGSVTSKALDSVAIRWERSNPRLGFDYSRFLHFYA